MPSMRTPTNMIVRIASIVLLCLMCCQFEKQQQCGTLNISLIAIIAAVCCLHTCDYRLLLFTRTSRGLCGHCSYIYVRQICPPVVLGQCRFLHELEGRTEHWSNELVLPCQVVVRKAFLPVVVCSFITIFCRVLLGKIATSGLFNGHNGETKVLLIT